MTVPIKVNPFDPNNMNAPVRAVSGIVRTGTVTFDTPYAIDNEYARWVYIGTSGDLSYTKQDGTIETLPNLAAGIWHPIWSIQINSSGTTIAANQLRWGD
jgi:hypothetical protein